MNTSAVAFILLLAIIPHTLAFRFSLTSSSPEMSLTFVVKGHQTFTAVSSGEQNHDVQVYITYFNSRMPRAQQVFNKTSNDLQFSHNYDEGTINVTITSTTGTARNVSFDFYSEDDPLVKVIDKKDIKYVQEVLGNVFKGLNTIQRNQQFQIQRDESHKTTLQDSQSSIKWTGIIKILFLLSSALIQLWIMKGFFKSNTHHSYEPVQST